MPPTKGRGKNKDSSLSSAKDKGGDPLDSHVGSRIRLRRLLLGYSQEKLGDALGLTFQQVQKYERGANRVSASRLFDLASVLGVPVSFFFDDLSPEVTAQVDQRLRDEGGSPGRMEDQETQDLLAAYFTIDSTLLRRRLRELIKSLGDSFHPDDEPEDSDEA